MTGRFALTLLACLAALAVPLAFGSFAQYFVLNVLLLALLSVSFNLLFGMTGLLSFGHAAFYAGGAYATALSLRAGWTMIPAILAGALLAPLEQTVAPAAAHWTKSAEPVMSTLIGGPFFFAGPIAGAALYLGLKEIIVRYTEYWLLIFGLVLLGLVLSMRGGVLGAIAALAGGRRPTAAGPLVARKEA